MISIGHFTKFLNCDQKIGKSLHGENIPITIKLKNLNYRYIFVVLRLPNFLRHDLATLKNALSISHGPRPLTAAPSGNVKIMESLLLMSYEAISNRLSLEGIFKF